MGIFGIKHQIPSVFRQLIGAQRFGHLIFIDADGIDAPEVRYGVLVARINLIHQLQQIGIDVFVVRNQVFIHRLVSAGFDLAGDVGNRGRHQVVAGFSG